MKPVKKVGMVHLKGINDKAYAKYKAEQDAKPKQYTNLWLQLPLTGIDRSFQEDMINGMDMGQDY